MWHADFWGLFLSSFPILTISTVIHRTSVCLDFAHRCPSLCQFVPCEPTPTSELRFRLSRVHPAVFILARTWAQEAVHLRLQMGLITRILNSGLPGRGFSADEEFPPGHSCYCKLCYQFIGCSSKDSLFALVASMIFLFDLMFWKFPRMCSAVDVSRMLDWDVVEFHVFHNYGKSSVFFSNTAFVSILVVLSIWRFHPTCWELSIPVPHDSPPGTNSLFSWVTLTFLF